MPTGIDINRGMTQRSSGPSGPLVSMYKDEPGVYYWKDGTPASEEDAQRAGFDVKKDAAIRRKRELERQARKRIETQVAEELAEATVEVDGEEVPVGAGPANEVIRRTSAGDPRETRVRRMDQAGPVLGFKVTDKATGDVLYQGKDTAEAERILQGGE